MFSEQFRVNLLENKEGLKFLHNSLYKINQPFPHVTLNDVFEESFIYELANQFPKPDNSWWKYSNTLEKKYAKDDLNQMPFVHKKAIALLQSKPFLEFLETLTGITDLINDETLRGGGLHQITHGGKLAIHSDFNIHPDTGLQRRINVLLYLNPEWLPAYRGNLELWDKDMKSCVSSITPNIGTMVIFTISDDANHGHPDPLQCPEHVTRKSIALYYYTKPTKDCGPAHSTIYKARPKDPRDPETEKLRQQRAKGRIKNEH